MYTSTVAVLIFFTIFRTFLGSIALVFSVGDLLVCIPAVD